MRSSAVVALVMLLAACGSDGGDAPSLPGSSVCSHAGGGVNWAALATADCPRLSDYGLFQSAAEPTQAVSAPGMLFAPATALFSDYARKFRFAFLPPGQPAAYREHDAFAFPVGTALVKTFAMPADADGSGPLRLLETRLLIRRENGWVGLPYVWRADGQDAELNVAGATIPVTLRQQGGSLSFSYQVPDRNQCQLCHQAVGGMAPISPKARHLNHAIDYVSGRQNQLLAWRDAGLLAGLPDDLSGVAAVPAWTDATTPLANRVRGYLDINCSHCHSDSGFGSVSGLRLEYWRDAMAITSGICKKPPGYDGGALGLAFDIVPGDGMASILPYRMSQLAAKDRMPPLGRQLVDAEAVTGVRDWINAMTPAGCE